MGNPTNAVGSSDRVDFVPRHIGANVFPNLPLFSRLLRFAYRKPPRIVVRDNRLRVEKTHIQLLIDVLALRTTIRAILPSTVLGNLDNGVEIYIGVLAAGGYEYAVTVLAVLALGAAVVSMSPALPVEEAIYFVEKSCQAALLTSAGTICDTDILLHVLPVHHATGNSVMFFPFLISGSIIEFRSGSFDPAWMWDLWRRGGLTFLSGVPTMYMCLKRPFERNLVKLPREHSEQYIAGTRQFRAMLCGTSAIPVSIAQFWTNIGGGKMILTRYGATEFGAPFKVPLNPKGTPEGSVGEIIPGVGVEVKLSEGDKGEVLVKSPQMFSRYLFNDNATAKAYNSEGFFKIGDIARREGHRYFTLGRASLDIIKTGGYKISALDIEREGLALPYVEEVMVVGVEDEEFGQRVAALISLRGDQDTYSALGDDMRRTITIEDLRKGLRARLAGYKLPTLLRVVEGELPKTATGKVLKRVLGQKYFPPGLREDGSVQTWYPKSASKL